MSTMESQEPPTTPPTDAERRSILCAFFQREWKSVLVGIRCFVQRARLASGADLHAVAEDILHDVIDRALRCAAAFDPTRRPMPWVLSIASNLIKQRKAELVRQRERTGRIFKPRERDEGLDSGACFDLIAAAGKNPEEVLASKQQIDSHLAHLSESDRRMIEYVIFHDMNGGDLAEALHISPGAARLRLHRTYDRLRRAVRSGPRIKP